MFQSERVPQHEDPLIIVKNLPKTIAENPVDFFRKNYRAVAARSYGRKRAVVRFESYEAASLALQHIHQREIDNSIVSAEFLGKRKLTAPAPTLQTTNIDFESKPPDFVKRLYALSAAHDFNQPPSSHLKYSYPRINRDILDSISIQLMSNRKFYTQVLHLMNRMNLDPPFLPRGQQSYVFHQIDAETQTDFQLIFSDESELEQSDEESREKLKAAKKRKADDVEQIKRKAQKILKIHKIMPAPTVRQQSEKDLGKIFDDKNDKKFSSLSAQKISMNVASVKLPQIESIEKTVEENLPAARNVQNNPIEKEKDKNHILTLEDLKANQIPENQLNELPVYKNYRKGDRSNKLYIKNLAKDVNEEDLKEIFNIFSKNFEIKLMQHGRMKGQAFVTFKEITDSKLHFVENVLKETNGYILKNKPMVICYGKKS